MCRFVVLEIAVSGRRITLLDSYGKYHVARLEPGCSARVGIDLHGPRAAIGLHFLVEARHGQRVSVVFQALCVARTDLPPRLGVVQPPLRSLIVSRRRPTEPGDSAIPPQLERAAKLHPRPDFREVRPAPYCEFAADGGVESPTMPRNG